VNSMMRGPADGVTCGIPLFAETKLVPTAMKDRKNPINTSHADDITETPSIRDC